MSTDGKCIISCALTGVLTDPARFNVPVTPEEMAASAKEAFDAGATIMHVHVRDPREGMGMLPTWDPDAVANVVDAIRDACKGVLINLTTGVPGNDISGPLACLERTKPEMAALNSGSLNYLKLTSKGSWAWPPMLFDNQVDKIQKYLDVMLPQNTIPECECFDTGIVRSVGMFHKAGMIPKPIRISFVMGVASGMACKPHWLKPLIEELPEGAAWQTIGIGREEVWETHREAARLGGNVRTGLEDTFYLPDGTKPGSNGKLVEAMAKIVREEGREVASAADVRADLGLPAV